MLGHDLQGKINGGYKSVARSQVWRVRKWAPNEPKIEPAAAQHSRKKNKKRSAHNRDPETYTPGVHNGARFLTFILLFFRRRAFSNEVEGRDASTRAQWESNFREKWERIGGAVESIHLENSGAEYTWSFTIFWWLYWRSLGWRFFILFHE